MRKIIIGIIAISVIILAAVISIIVLADGLPPIDPDNGDNGDPVSDSITIVTPYNNYQVPTDMYYAIDVEGTVTSDSVVKIVVTWHDDLSYSIRTINNPSSNWEASMLVQLLGSGSHSLHAKAFDSGNNVLAEVSINVVIPSHWVYLWNSNNLEDCQREGEYVKYDWFYGFRFPYTIDTDDVKWLEGEILRIKGQFHVKPYLLAEGYSREFWLDVWNSFLGKWSVVNKDIRVPGDGVWHWHTVDITVDSVWGNTIGFAGAEGQDLVDGFVGEVWVEPGTYIYQMSPLDVIMGLFNTDSIDNPPHP